LFTLYGVSLNLATVGWIVIVLGLLSMFIGVTMALRQTDLKRLIAYNSVGESGFILLGLGVGLAVLGNPGALNTYGLAAISGGIFHMINYVLFEGLLFLAAGAIFYRIGTRNLNEMGVAITGPFFCHSPSYDPSIAPWPFNPLEAKMLLDEESWIDMDGDGIRDKMVDGKRIPFRFSLIYFSKNLSSKVICEYIATTLREIGIDCQLRGLDSTDLSHTFEDKSFDAIFMGWRLGTPPDDPRQLWHSSGAKEKGSSNAVGFVNYEADIIIDSLQYEYDAENRSSLYHQFHKIIHEEAPYTFLYSPKTRLLYRDYVKNLFIPRDREDLVPEADISQPDDRVIWLDR
nr:Oligopeptide-binding protein AppA [Chlamydiota bacterium]